MNTLFYILAWLGVIWLGLCVAGACYVIWRLLKDWELK